jgi:hypothetical protein
MAQKANFTPVDKYESDRGEDERFDLETQSRLEARSIDTFPASDSVSATQSAPAVEHPHREGPSFWQAIKTMFK